MEHVIEHFCVRKIPFGMVKKNFVEISRLKKCLPLLVTETNKTMKKKIMAKETTSGIDIELVGIGFVRIIIRPKTLKVDWYDPRLEGFATLLIIHLADKIENFKKGKKNERIVLGP